MVVIMLVLLFVKELFDRFLEVDSILASFDYDDSFIFTFVEKISDISPS